MPKGLEMWRYELFTDVAGYWRWHLRGANGQIVATSGESFASHYNALRAVLDVRASAGIAALPTDDLPPLSLRIGRGRRARRQRARRLRLSPVESDLTRMGR